MLHVRELVPVCAQMGIEDVFRADMLGLANLFGPVEGRRHYSARSVGENDICCSCGRRSDIASMPL